MVFSLVLLLLITMVSIFTGKTVSLERKIMNNDNRSKMAFNYAEAGIADAIAYLDNDPDVDGDGNIDPIYDTDNDGVGDTNTATIGTGSVTVLTTDVSGGNMSAIQIEATGLSDDSTATRTIVLTASTINPLGNGPEVPLVTRGNVIISGSATVTNPEGHHTIWSGDSIDLGSNNSTATNVADFSDANYPGCMDTPLTCNTVSSSNKTTIGLDVIENDSSLSGLSLPDFFENTFGINPTAYRNTSVTLETTAANANNDLDLATNEVIWVEGDTTFENNTTVGCESQVNGGNVCPANNQNPSIVIINGDLTMDGTPHIYGLLFVLGNVNLTGNATVYGSMVVAGSATSTGGGSLDIIYHSDLLNDLTTIGPLAVASGTWRDF